MILRTGFFQRIFRPNKRDVLRLASLTHVARVTLLVPLTAMVHAQDALEHLIVNAEEIPESDQDALGTLAGGGDLQNLLKLQANAHVGGVPGSAFSLRGINQEGTLVPGNRTNVGLTVLSGNLPRSTNSLWVLGTPSWDMQGLSVEYGPSLFGKGPASIGGELRLDPNVPEFFNQGKWLTEIGTHGTYRSGITANTLLIPDHLAMRLNLFADGNDGGITNTYYDDNRFAATDRLMLRGQLRWQPAGDPDTVIDAQFETMQMRGNSLGLAGMRPDFGLFERKVELDEKEQVPADQWALSMSLETQLNPSSRVESWGTLQKAKGSHVADFDSSAINHWWYRADVKEQRISGGSRFHQELGRLNYFAGIYADAAEYLLDFRGRGLSSQPEGSPLFSMVDERVDMAAFYLRGDLDMGAGVQLFGGVRIDSQWRKVDIISDFPDTPETGQRGHVHSLEALPEVGIEWGDDQRSMGLKISRAYRPGGIGYALSLGQVQPYGAERGWEFQYHGTIEMSRTRFGARLFYALLDEHQVPVVIPDGIPFLDQFILNAGSSTRYGAEVDWNWQGPGAFHAGVKGGWLMTEFRDLDEYGLGQSGTKFPNAPVWNAGIIAAWQPDTGWFTEGAFTWQDATYAQFGSPQSTHLEERLELSARLGYRWSRGECYVFGTNLLDRDFALVRRDYNRLGDRVQGKPSLPRVLGVGFSIEW